MIRYSISILSRSVLYIAAERSGRSINLFVFTEIISIYREFHYNIHVNVCVYET